MLLMRTILCYAQQLYIVVAVDCAYLCALYANVYLNTQTRTVAAEMLIVVGAGARAANVECEHHATAAATAATAIRTSERPAGRIRDSRVKSSACASHRSRKTRNCQRNVDYISIRAFYVRGFVISVSSCV